MRKMVIHGENNMGSVPIFSPGQYYDAETGLHYNYFRDYNPVIGRYVEADPIGLGGGINQYIYVGNNTISWVDTLGLVRRPQNPVPINTLFCPSNCKEQDREVNTGIVARRTVITGPFGFKGALRALKPPYLPWGHGTRVKLEQVMWLTFVRLTCKCKDKCGREFNVTLVGNEDSEWEIIHMWEQTVRWDFWQITYESEWRQRF